MAIRWNHVPFTSRLLAKPQCYCARSRTLTGNLIKWTLLFWQEAVDAGRLKHAWTLGALAVGWLWCSSGIPRARYGRTSLAGPWRPSSWTRRAGQSKGCRPSCGDLLANQIPENSQRDSQVTGITVLITIFRKGKKAVRMNKLSPAAAFCLASPTLSPPLLPPPRRQCCQSCQPAPLAASRRSTGVGGVTKLRHVGFPPGKWWGREIQCSPLQVGTKKATPAHKHP